MKPAPPVTRSLSGGELIEHLPQLRTPMRRHCTREGARTHAVEHAVRRPLRGGWILRRTDWQHRNRVIEDAALQGFLLDCDGEVVPARNACVAPVKDPGRSIERKHPPQDLRKTGCPGRRSSLIANHTH